MLDDKWLLGTIAGLFASVFGYVHKVESESASKDDVKYIRGRVDALCDRLLDKKNGGD